MAISDSIPSQLRLRVFAGPNGSGKSTIIQEVRDAVINEKHLDFGIYINADDIASALRSNQFSFEDYELTANKASILQFGQSSGLLDKSDSLSRLSDAFILDGNRMIIKQASELAYQAFFFDNSIENEPYKLVGHFKKIGNEKKWDQIEESKISNWFKKYYSAV